MLACYLRDKWVAALRSGEFEQGENALQSEGKFCCLGVLCEVAGIEKRDRELYGGVEYRVLNATGKWTYEEFPLEIMGLDAEDCARLAQLNDGGTSFPDIATEIEENVACEP